VKDPQLGGSCFCSVLGQLGEIFAVHAYRGMRSYCLFKKMAAGGPIDGGEFFGEQHSLTLEFLTPGKLSPADRDLALVLGHRLKKGTMVPQFRAGLSAMVSHGTRGEGSGALRRKRAGLLSVRRRQS
jgi:hypothetical protein